MKILDGDFKIHKEGEDILKIRCKQQKGKAKEKEIVERCFR